MTIDNRDPSLSDPVPSSHPETVAIFDHNASVLATAEEALRGDTPIPQVMEGTPCFRLPLVLYVNSSSGLIHGLASYAKLRQEADRLNPNHDPNHILELGEVDSAVSGLSDTVLLDPTTVRVNAWYAFPQIYRREEEGLRFRRPPSWARNNVVLLRTDLELRPLKELLPDPIDYGVFTQSIQNHNSQPQSDVIATAK